MSLQIQFLTMGMMFASGWLLGFSYDLLNVVGRQAKFPRWLVSVVDLIYWAAATLFVFRMLYASNFGEVRLFVFIGLIMGVVLYYISFSAWSVRMIHVLIDIVMRLVYFVIRFVYWTILRPVYFLYQIIGIFLGFLASIAIFLYRVVVQLMYPLLKFCTGLMRFMGIVSIWGHMKRWLNKWSHRGKH